MPQYLYQVAYTPESLAAQIKNPQDRMEIVGKQIADAVGAKILGAMSPAMRLPCSQPHGCEQPWRRLWGQIRVKDIQITPSSLPQLFFRVRQSADVWGSDPQVGIDASP